MTLLRNVAIAATIFDTVLAGAGLDRVVVQMPAWRMVGVQAWAAYSRHADLGNGRFLYPFVAFGGFALSLAAAIIAARRHDLRRTTRVALYSAAALTALGLLLTLEAAPFMLSLDRIGDDPAALTRAFEGFDFWG